MCLLRSIGAALLATVTFVIAFFVVDIALIWSVLAGFGVLLLVLLVWRPPNPAMDLPAREGIDRQEAYRTIQAARAKVAELRGLKRKLPDWRVHERLDAVADLADRIVDELEEDPADIPSARRFLDYYLETAVVIVRRYADLKAKGGDIAEVQETLGGFDEALDTIEATFAKQYDRLLRNEALELDTDVTVFRRMADMEGL